MRCKESAREFGLDTFQQIDSCDQNGSTRRQLSRPFEQQQLHKYADEIIGEPEGTARPIAEIVRRQTDQRASVMISILRQHRAFSTAFTKALPDRVAGHCKPSGANYSVETLKVLSDQVSRGFTPDFGSHLIYRNSAGVRSACRFLDSEDLSSELGTP